MLFLLISFPEMNPIPSGKCSPKRLNQSPIKYGLRTPTDLSVLFGEPDDNAFKASAMNRLSAVHASEHTPKLPYLIYYRC